MTQGFLSQVPLTALPVRPARPTPSPYNQRTPDQVKAGLMLWLTNITKCQGNPLPCAKLAMPVIKKNCVWLKEIHGTIG